MAKKYTPEFRAEAVKLSQEIGARPASERLNINLDTMYTWISKAKHHQSEVDALIQKKGGTVALADENNQLRRRLREREEEIEILQDALGFFVKRRKK
jgi:transposase